MSSYETLLSTSGMKTLLLQRIRLITIEVFKSVNDYNPIFMTSMFVRKHNQYDFRDNFKLIVPHFNNVTLKVIRVLWRPVRNDVPSEIKAATNISNFKRLIKMLNGQHVSVICVV